jgi:hypothetical protein
LNPKDDVTPYCPEWLALKRQKMTNSISEDMPSSPLLYCCWDLRGHGTLGSPLGMCPSTDGPVDTRQFNSEKSNWDAHFYTLKTCQNISSSLICNRQKFGSNLPVHRSNVDKCHRALAFCMHHTGSPEGRWLGDGSRAGSVRLSVDRASALGETPWSEPFCFTLLHDHYT